MGAAGGEIFGISALSDKSCTLATHPDLLFEKKLGGDMAPHQAPRPARHRANTGRAPDEHRTHTQTRRQQNRTERTTQNLLSDRLRIRISHATTLTGIALAHIHMYMLTD